MSPTVSATNLALVTRRCSVRLERLSQRKTLKILADLKSAVSVPANPNEVVCIKNPFHPNDRFAPGQSKKRNAPTTTSIEKSSAKEQQGKKCVKKLEPKEVRKPDKSNEKRKEPKGRKHTPEEAKVRKAPVKAPSYETVNVRESLDKERALMKRVSGLQTKLVEKHEIINGLEAKLSKKDHTIQVLEDRIGQVEREKLLLELPPVPLLPPVPRTPKEVHWLCPLCDAMDGRDGLHYNVILQHVVLEHARYLLDEPIATDLTRCHHCVNSRVFKPSETGAYLCHLAFDHKLLAKKLGDKYASAFNRFMPVPNDRAGEVLTTQCLRCGVKFVRRSDFDVHLALHHYKDLLAPEAMFEDGETVKYGCSFYEDCKRRFKTREGLVGHMEETHQVMEDYFGVIHGQNDFVLNLLD